MKYTTISYYGTTTRFIHWITAILVLAAFAFGPEGSEAQIYSAENAFGRELHETLGVCVFAITIIRLVWRFNEKGPALPYLPRWMNLMSLCMKTGLYWLLLALPATAIAGAWLEGHPLTFLGGWQVPPLVQHVHGLGALIAETHAWFGDAILWLAGLHSAGALFHHFALGDTVLLSMLPRWFSSRRR
ncbi:MAG TPA: cytochrome b [Burkholderiaceae bacterium]|jgi:cytochrome b561